MKQSTPFHPGKPIAIIGSGCRFPGEASSPSKLWALLSRPSDVLSEIPSTRFNPDGFYHPDGEYHGHGNVRHSYVLSEDHREFDATFFNVSAAEASAIDPQQRMLLECVYEALEDGGQVMSRLKGSSTAVYVGLMCEEYSDLQIRDLNTMPKYFPTGTARSVVSNRISYFFDWHGPSMTIDTACSSSLVAVHQALQELRSGSSRLAIAAGTNLILGPEPYIAESTFHMLSPQGRSQMWDAKADGYARGDGVAAVVLKRLSDAIADGDAIDCVIRETGVNQDGRTKGITVPSPDAQVALVQDTYHRAGLDLSTTKGRPQFFEAHGTGTLAGDPLEAEAIHRAIGKSISEDGENKRLFVGSIKSVVGHTEGTAGIAGLLKAMLAVQHAIIPPNLLFEKLNPAIEPFYDGVQVPTEALKWPEVAQREPRRASVNSFGFGGTNAHAIVESYESEIWDLRSHRTRGHRPSILPFQFSAQTKSSLKRSLKGFVEYLIQNPYVDLNDLSYTLGVRRSAFLYRAAYPALSAQDLKQRIETSLTRSDWESAAVVQASNSPAQILGVFTGQGAQWAGMGRELIQDSPFVQARLAQLDAVLRTLPPDDRPSWFLEAEIVADASRSRLNTAFISQPACTAIQILLVDLLEAAGISFSAVVGHSSGEIAAAYACGAISARDAIIIAYYRGLHSGLAGGRDGQSGAMLAAGTSLEDAEELCALPEFKGRICVAASNSPTSVTLSGDMDAIDEMREVFEGEEKFARLLRVDTAYHSHHMLPCSEAYLGSLKKSSISVRKPKAGCKWFSSVFYGEVMNNDWQEKGLDALYWGRNMTRTVMFSAAVEAAIAESNIKPNMVLEVGPHSALRSPAEDTIKVIMKICPPYGSCLIRNQNSIGSFGEALGFVWKNASNGIVDFERFHDIVYTNDGSKPMLLKGLPSYQWDHDRIYWHESRRSRALRTRSEAGHPLLGTLSPDSTQSDIVWQNLLRISELPWLTGHQLQGQAVFPAAGYVVLALEAGAQYAKGGALQLIELHDLSIHKAITFEDEMSSVETIFHLHVEQDASQKEQKTVVASFRFHFSGSDLDSTSLSASGNIKLLFKESLAPSIWDALPPREPMLPNMVDVDEDEFYAELKKLGYQYSGSFRALRLMTRKLGYGRGVVSRPDAKHMHISEQELLVHPGTLDAAFQAIFLAFSWPGDGRLCSLHVPTSISYLRINPAACRANLDNELAFDSVVTSEGATSEKVGIRGDVDIFSADGSEGLIQVEGIDIVPFAAASAAQDTLMFFDNIYGVASPDGELALGANRTAPASEIELGWILERISYFYLRRLTLEITPEEESKTEWHHQKLLAYARHMVDQVNAEKQAYGKIEWNNDTSTALNDLMDTHNDKIEIQLMRSVGENLPAAVRGETVILQHMLKDGMLNKYYVESLGLRPYTAFLSEIIAQMTHRYPHMSILEIGAGTGGATKSIMNKIGGAFAEYTFTDISSGFFETAEDVFSKNRERMVFQVLDAEKDVLEQGFQEHSYDLVIASLVLHATKDLHATLRNVRKLLRPGGFLVMTEVTSNDTMRMSFTMGGLSGWWIGADSGRPWSPCVSSAQWNTLLFESGFSGIETITPEMMTLPRPFSVIVSRATDERINLLIEPTYEESTLSTIKDLLIVTGSSLDNHRLAQSIKRLLKASCSSISTIQTLEDLDDSSSFSPQLTVLSLIELEQPVFKTLTPLSFKALKKLFLTSQQMLWVTRGCRQSEPYANMTVGFARAVMMEVSHIRLQTVVDFDVGIKPSAQLLADELLRHRILIELERAGNSDDILWSSEPEITINASGYEVIPRIKPNRKWNNNYNASRREIVSHLPTADESVRVQLNRRDGELSVSSTTMPVNVSHDEDVARIRVLYSSSTALSVSSTTALYPCIGREVKTDAPIVALTRDISSCTDVPRRFVAPYDGPTVPEAAAVFLNALVAQRVAFVICEATESNTSLLLIDPDPSLVKFFRCEAVKKNITITCITSNPSTGDSDFVFVHPLTSSRNIKKHLPSNVSCILHSCGSVPRSEDLVSHLVDCLPQTVKVVNASDSTWTALHHNDVATAGSSAFVDAVESIALALGSQQSCKDKPAIISASDFPRGPHSWSTIVDWNTADNIAVRVKPQESMPLLRPDRTYLLVGLAGAGGLGLSLAEWMIDQGAKYIVLTSRNPKVHPEWLSVHAAQGVRVQAMTNDITNRASLQQLIANIRESWPPIAGVANGAMVLHDSALEQMTYDQMMCVLRPKVDGTRYLDEIFRNDPLDFFVLFSSLSCVFGNSGQSNYAAANMYMISLAAQRRQRGVAASVVDIGAIMGIGYMAREVSHNVLAQLVNAGYRKMSESDFRLAFANAVESGQKDSDQPEELITGLHVALPEENLKPAWSENPRFAHVIQKTASKAFYKKDKAAGTSSSRELLIHARTKAQVLQIIQDDVLAKLRIILQLHSDTTNEPSFLLERAADDLGIDSLVAVELRSWFLRELDVDVPVLKILGGAKIAELVEFAVNKLPSALAPEFNDQILVEDAGDVPDAANPTSVMSQESPESTEGSAIATPDHREGIRTGSSAFSVSAWSSEAPKFPSLEGARSPLPNVESQRMEKVTPISFGQSRFWFMSQFVPDPTVFNVTCCMSITADVSAQDLTKAVQDLGRRHEGLRTCFFTNENHEPMQGILAESPLYLESLEISSENNLSKNFQEMQQHRFDLSKGKTMRMKFLSRSRTQHYLIIGYHHINMDGTSLAVLISDLRRLYSGEKLSAPTLQYTDFSKRQYDRLRDGHWKEGIDFWRKQYQELPDPLPILNISPNSSRPRPSVTAYQHLKSEKRANAPLSNKIRSICRKLKVTPFHLYCTVFQVMLARLASTEDVCIGIADANRTDAGAMESIGMFLNQFPVRLQTHLDQSFASTIMQTKKTILSALANSDIPFNVILDEVEVERSTTHSPLFQAFIDYRQVTEKQPFGNGQLEGQQYALSGTPYDIVVDIIDNPAGNASISMMVQEDLYTDGDVKTLLDCYLNLLYAFSGDHNLPIGEPQIFDAAHVEHALTIGKGPQLDFGDLTMLDEIDRIASETPSSTAIKDGSGLVYSYKEMIFKSRSIARAILKLNIAPKSRIAVLQEPTADWICSMFGIWQAGATYVPLETSQGAPHLATILRDAKPEAVIAHVDTLTLLEEIGWDRPNAAINTSNLLVTPAIPLDSPGLSPNDEAIILYTSGSTGIPKGISLPHRVIFNAIKGFLHNWPLEAQIVLQQIALSFDLSWWQALLGLATKGSVVVAMREARKDPIALTQIIVSENITMTAAVPSETVAWLQHGDLIRLKNSRWALHIAGGEDFSFNLIKYLQSLNKPELRALNVYGPAEAMIPHVFEVPYQTLTVNDMPVPIGRVMPNYTIYVVDEQNNPVPAGISGHLIMGGAGIANGYINNPSLTEEQFPIDKRAGPRALSKGWILSHRSGDRGYINEHDGLFYIQARISGDTQVKIGGQRMNLREIEASIVNFSGGTVVEAVAHVQKPENENTSAPFLVTHVVLTPDVASRYENESAKNEFLSRLAAELPLPPYMRPSIIRALPTLPLNHHGKVDRKRIKELQLDLGNWYAPLQTLETESQEKMRNIWMSVLGTQARPLHGSSDFFLIGGNSLSLISVQAEIKKRYGLAMPLIQLFQGSTLTQMAQVLDGETNANSISTGVDWPAETKVDPDFQKLYLPLPPPNEGATVILTGATGFLGRELVEKMVANEQIKTVHCIAVRDPAKLCSITSPKVVVYAGDLTQPLLGLPLEVAEKLFTDADTIIHNGADVSFLKSFASLKTANLASTKELVRLTLQSGKAKRFHYVSTAGVAALLGRELGEEPLGAYPPAASMDGYVISKWACESYLQKVNTVTGLPVTIHRPAAIVGVNAPRLDVMHNVLHFAEQLQAVPEMSALEGWFQFVSVETVATDMVDDVIAGPLEERLELQYHNHCGDDQSAVDIHGLGGYLTTKHGFDFATLSDAEWVGQAEAAGLSPEVAEYLKSVSAGQGKSGKWVFPKVWKDKVKRVN